MDSPIKPFAVPMRVAARLLGDKARSEIYAEVGRGRLVAVKDASKTLITLESIERYMKSLPHAKIKPAAPRRSRGAAA
jgi:hypothetical protein